jgi:alginate O-acetyltransferase complex protein AlgI
MVFNSLTFVIFFAVVLAIYYGLKSWKARKFVLLVSSYLFYAAWNPPFVALLWFSTVIDWYAAKVVYGTSRKAIKNLGLGMSLAANLGLLAYFKYAGFALESFTAILNTMGVEFAAAVPDIILPMGISFYTFQTLSYTIDIYRGKDKPSESFLDYTLYVTFFPQLVAGPIVRSTEFLPQCKEQKLWHADNFAYGLALMVFGLFQKIVLADALLAPVVERVYDQMTHPNSLAAWTGTLAFSGQIFFDFAGYSTCAIGCSLCLGFTLPRNFRSPYGAIGFSDFWQRWHITLSTWLRDYLYIPLGGNRHGLHRTLANLIATMLIGGLWHGAAWTFVVWGALHGCYLVVERVLQKMFGQLEFWKSAGARSLLMIGTFVAICFAWVFFRASDFTKATAVTFAMASPTVIGDALDSKSILITLTLVTSLLATHALTRKVQIQDRLDQIPTWLIASALGIMLYLCVTMPGNDRAFIYFQF